MYLTVLLNLDTERQFDSSCQNVAISAEFIFEVCLCFVIIVYHK